MLSQQLLDILCCPACHSKLTYEQDRNVLTCSSCSRVYAIRDDIPIMLVDSLPSPLDDRSSQR